MIDRAREEARQFFDDLWAQGDYWALETAAHERARYGRYLERNVGFEVEYGEVLAGEKDATKVESLVTLLVRLANP